MECDANLTSEFIVAEATAPALPATDIGVQVQEQCFPLQSRCDLSSKLLVLQQKYDMQIQHLHSQISFLLSVIPRVKVTLHLDDYLIKVPIEIHECISPVSVHWDSFAFDLHPDDVGAAQNQVIHDSETHAATAFDLEAAPAVLFEALSDVPPEAPLQLLLDAIPGTLPEAPPVAPFSPILMDLADHELWGRTTFGPGCAT